MNITDIYLRIKNTGMAGFLADLENKDKDKDKDKDAIADQPKIRDITVTHLEVEHIELT